MYIYQFTRLKSPGVSIVLYHMKDNQEVFKHLKCSPEFRSSSCMAERILHKYEVNRITIEGKPTFVLLMNYCS